MAFGGQQVNEHNLSNLKDILQTYNKITEACFYKCCANLNYRTLTDLESHCVDTCSSKHINGNQRMMATFMELQSAKQKLMYEETLKQQKEQEEKQLTLQHQGAAATADVQEVPSAADSAQQNGNVSQSHAGITSHNVTDSITENTSQPNV